VVGCRAGALLQLLLRVLLVLLVVLLLVAVLLQLAAGASRPMLLLWASVAVGLLVARARLVVVGGTAVAIALAHDAKHRSTAESCEHHRHQDAQRSTRYVPNSRRQVQRHLSHQQQQS
jgi:hypothetical protein